MRRLAIVAGATVAAVLPATTDGTVEPTKALATSVEKCTRQYTRAQFRVRSGKVMHSPARVTRARGRRLHLMIRCAYSPRSRELMRSHLRKLRTWRRSRIGRLTLAWKRVPAWLRGVLRRIAVCESHGDPRAVSSGGLYRGKYQFDSGTWGAAGGRGDPASAAELEQDLRAARLYLRRGAQPWPVCGRR